MQAEPGEFAPPPDPPATPGSEVAVPDPAPPPVAMMEPKVELPPLLPVPKSTAAPPAPTLMESVAPGVTANEGLYNKPPAPPPPALPDHPPEAPPPTTRTESDVTFSGTVMLAAPTVTFW